MSETKPRIGQKGAAKEIAKKLSEIRRKPISKEVLDIVAEISERELYERNSKESAPVDFDGLISKIESDREDGIIHSKVLTDKVWYEESDEKPGMFFRFTKEGKKTLGKFIEGKFVEEGKRKKG